MTDPIAPCWCGDPACADSEEILHCTDECPEDCQADHWGER